MIEIILDASQLEVLESCPHKWQRGYQQHLTVKRPNAALSIGSWYHTALKFYYESLQDGIDVYKAIPQTIRLAEELTKMDGISSRWPEVSNPLNTKFHLQRLQDYMFKWLSEDASSRIVAVEQGFSTLLYEDASRRYILEGMIDLITERPKGMGLTVTDHKTQSRSYLKDFYCHQVLNYMSFTGANYFEYNYIGLQDAISENTFSRKPWAAPPGVLEQWQRDAMNTFNEEFHRRHQGFNEREGDKYPRRRAACQTKFGLCEFHSICKEPDPSETGSWQPIVIASKYKTKENQWKAWS